MPYYSAGDYYTGDYYRGDNYAAGGLFSSIGKFLGKAAGSLIKATPVGAVASSLIPTFGHPRQPQLPMIIQPQGPIQPVPGIKGKIQRLLPGGATGYMLRKRRRMDFGNMKALRRADRRAHGFLRAYSRAVRHFVPKQPKGRAYVAFRKKRK